MYWRRDLLSAKWQCVQVRGRLRAKQTKLVSTNAMVNFTAGVAFRFLTSCLYFSDLKLLVLQSQYPKIKRQFFTNHKLYLEGFLNRLHGGAMMHEDTAAAVQRPVGGVKCLLTLVGQSRKAEGCVESYLPI